MRTSMNTRVKIKRFHLQVPRNIRAGTANFTIKRLLEPIVAPIGPPAILTMASAHNEGQQTLLHQYQQEQQLCLQRQNAPYFSLKVLGSVTPKGHDTQIELAIRHFPYFIDITL